MFLLLDALQYKAEKHSNDPKATLNVAACFKAILNNPFGPKLLQTPTTLQRLTTALLTSESKPYKTQIWETMAIMCLGSAAGRMAVLLALKTLANKTGSPEVLVLVLAELEDAIDDVLYTRSIVRFLNSVLLSADTLADRVEFESNLRSNRILSLLETNKARATHPDLDKEINDLLEVLAEDKNEQLKHQPPLQSRQPGLMAGGVTQNSFVDFMLRQDLEFQGSPAVRAGLENSAKAMYEYVRDDIKSRILQMPPTNTNQGFNTFTKVVGLLLERCLAGETEASLRAALTSAGNSASKSQPEANAQSTTPPSLAMDPTFERGKQQSVSETPSITSPVSPPPPPPPPPNGIGGPPGPPPLPGVAPPGAPVLFDNVTLKQRDPMAPPRLPSTNMKKINWKRVLRIHPKFKGTVWEDIYNTHDRLASDHKLMIPDYDNLEKKFKNTPTKNRIAHDGQTAAHKSLTQTKTELLDDRRAQSLAVFLGSKEKQFMYWIKAIEEVNFDILKPDKAIQLRDALPHIRERDMDEIKALRASKDPTKVAHAEAKMSEFTEMMARIDAAKMYSSEKLQELTHADQFLVALHKIPGYHILLECIYSFAEFDEQMDDIESPLAGLGSWLKEVRDSEDMKVILCYVLKAGNFINGKTSSLKGAAAFELPSIEDLRELKSNNDHSTFMDVMAAAIVDQRPGIADTIARWVTLAKRLPVDGYKPTSGNVKPKPGEEGIFAALPVHSRDIDLRIRPLAIEASKQPFYGRFETFFHDAIARLDASQQAINELDELMNSFQKKWLCPDGKRCYQVLRHFIEELHACIEQVNANEAKLAKRQAAKTKHSDASIRNTNMREHISGKFSFPEADDPILQKFLNPIDKATLVASTPSVVSNSDIASKRQGSDSEAEADDDDWDAEDNR